MLIYDPAFKLSYLILSMIWFSPCDFLHSILNHSIRMWGKSALKLKMFNCNILIFFWISAKFRKCFMDSFFITDSCNKCFNKIFQNRKLWSFFEKILQFLECFQGFIDFTVILLSELENQTSIQIIPTLFTLKFVLAETSK